MMAMSREDKGKITIPGNGIPPSNLNKQSITKNSQMPNTERYKPAAVTQSKEDDGYD